MNADELAAAMGWEVTGTNADGSATFRVVDEAGTGKNFLVAADGSFSWLPDTPAPDDQPADVTPPAVVTPPPLDIIAPQISTGAPLLVLIAETPPPVVAITTTAAAGTLPGNEETDDTSDTENRGDEPPAVVWLPPPPPIVAPPTSQTGIDLQPRPTTPPIMPAATQSVIDEAGNEILWDVNPATGEAENIRSGRPALTRFTWDAAGQQKVWETAWDGSGVYNLRNGAKVPTSTIDAAGQEIVWSIDPDTGAAVNIQKGRGPITVRTVDADGQTKVWETAWDGSGVYNLRNGPANQAPTNGQIDVVTPSAPPAAGGNTGGGGTLPPPIVTAPPVVNSSMRSFTHPVSGAVGDIPLAWQRVGTDRQGNPVFQIRDADGTVKQWSLDGDLQAFGLANVATLGVYVPQNTGAPAGTGSTGGDKKAPWLLYAAAFAVGWFAWSRRRS